MKDKKNNVSVILAILAIVVIAIILIVATIMKFDYDNKKVEEPNTEENGNNNDSSNNDDVQDDQLILAQQQAINYILALENSFQQNLTNDPTYVIPNNEYITDVVYDLGVDAYPEVINFFIENGKVTKGNITINNYSFNYENGILS